MFKKYRHKESGKKRFVKFTQDGIFILLPKLEWEKANCAYGEVTLSDGSRQFAFAGTLFTYDEEEKFSQQYEPIN